MASLDNIQVNVESSYDDELVEIEGDDVEEVDQISKSNMKGKNLKQKLLKRRSSIWEFFEMLLEGPDNTKRCRYKACGVTYNANARYGTGNMKRHIVACPKSNTRDVGQMLLVASGSSGSLGLASIKFNAKKFRELLVSSIIMHDLPFHFVEYEGIRTLLQYLRPDIQLLSINTAKSNYVKMHQWENGRIKAMLQATPSRISLTSDLWSSLISDGYLSLTTHFIDKNRKLQKRILNFSYMPPPHIGAALCETIFNLLLEWGIEMKIFLVTLDNASVNDVSADSLKDELNLKGLFVCNGDFFHLRRCAHVLNLVVQEGLKGIDSCIEKIRESVKYVKGSQVRKQKFLECVKLVSMGDKKGLYQDVATRWNSTYLMLDSALFYRRVFQHLSLSDSNYKKFPSIKEWERVEKVHKFLKVFYEATLTFSGTKYPTSSLYFPVIIYCYTILKDALESEDEYLKSMATKMWGKFQKYWANFSDTLVIAAVLDPRYKVEFVDFVYKKLYGLDSLQSLNFHDKLHALFNEYAEKYDGCPSSPNNGNAMKTKRSKSTYGGLEGMDVDCSLFKEFDDVSLEKSYSSKPQLQLYLEEPRLNRNEKLDALGYWKSNQFRYPIVATMAHDILAIPVETVASEAAFSVRGHVLDQFRSSLKPDMVDAIICTRDWLFGDKGGSTIDEDIEELTQDVVNFN